MRAPFEVQNSKLAIKSLPWRFTDQNGGLNLDQGFLGLFIKNDWSFLICVQFMHKSWIKFVQELKVKAGYL